MKTLSYRPAVPDDVEMCIKIRGLTRENAFSEAELREVGVTADSWRAGIEDGSAPGFIASVGEVMAGYCFGDRVTGEVTVLALLPEYEGLGIGKYLLDQVAKELQYSGWTRLFLACASDPNVRSYGFYRHLGWTWTGVRDDAGDDILELVVA